MVLTDAERADWPALKQIYREAFPADERAPFFLLRHRARQGRARMLVVRDGKQPAGFAYLVGFRDLVYLFYFAVRADLRGCGYGGTILRLLQAEYPGRRIFLSREPLDPEAENYPQRVSRREFYLRCGFTDQPCRVVEGKMRYDVMGIGGQVTAEEYGTLISGWSGPLLRRLIEMRFEE